MSNWQALLKAFGAVAQAYVSQDFVGQIEVNIFKGAITNVNVRQSYKVDDKEAATTK